MSNKGRSRNQGNRSRKFRLRMYASEAVPTEVFIVMNDPYTPALFVTQRALEEAPTYNKVYYGTRALTLRAENDRTVTKSRRTQE